MSSPPATHSAPSVSILIVDDNAAKRLALKAILLPLGYAIDEAESGVAALRCLMTQDYAMILLDVHMPDMDGFETAGLIRQRAQSEMTPIIFITALTSDEIVQIDRYAQGAVDFIFAPVAPEALRAKASVFANLYIRAQLLAAQAQELKSSADRLRLLNDAAPIGIFHTDAENKYFYTNPRWAEIAGVTSEAASGQAWDVIMAAAERAELAVEFPDGAGHQSEFSRRFEIAQAGSPSRVALMTSKAMRDRDGRIEGWVGTLADVTAEVDAETAMSAARDGANEASRLKSDFLANMSHEIRTPMNGVIGMADLLLETQLDSRQRDYAQTVRNSGEALLTIINDILDFSKVEAGKLELEHVQFSPQTIVEDVLDLLAGAAQAQGLELIAVVDSAVPTVVSGDPGRLRQVLTNLVGNSIKFTAAGEIVVRVNVSEPAQTGCVLGFAVSDPGDGIAADKLETIFEPFVQADTSTSRKYGGTGLGLAISSQLVTLMGGDCGASSELGEGSTFWFTIRVDADGAQTTLPPAHDPDLSGLTVLIVDDSRTQLDVLSAHLTAWGMIVEEAVSGAAALRAMRSATAQARPFAVVVIDRAMPVMNGPELIDLIAAEPTLRMPMVLMTSLGREPDLGKLAAAGVGALLSKPVHADDLRASLLVAMGARRTVLVPGTIAAPAVLSGPMTGRLLLAEDNLINQKVAVAMLSSAGYQVDTVLNGVAAVEAVASQRYDVVLMDCQMPGLSGYEAATAIRAEESADRRTPIIAMTAGARREDRERCLAAGMDGYLCKPVSKDALLASVARSISEQCP